MIDGNYGGLGLSVRWTTARSRSSPPSEDSPAGRAGIKAGDYITHIDGKLIYGRDARRSGQADARRAGHARSR